MNRTNNNFIGASALLIGFSIVLGAFGAHILNPGLEEKYIRTLATANQYFIINSIGLLLISTLDISVRNTRLAYLLITLGVICFSGSLYGIVLCKYFDHAVPFILGPITPIGGLLLIFGWVTIAFTYFRK